MGSLANDRIGRSEWYGPLARRQEMARAIDYIVKEAETAAEFLEK